MGANVFYPFDGNPEDEAAWQAFVAEHRDPAAGEEQPVTTPSTAVKKLSELFLLYVVVVALVGALLQQQRIRQVETLASEVQRLQAALATATAALEAPVTATGVSSRATDSPVFHVVETTYFHFVVTMGNMDAVTDLIPAIDEKYRRLWVDLGLVPSTTAQKYVVYVTAGSEGLPPNLPKALGIITVDLAAVSALPSGDRVDQGAYLYAELFDHLARRGLEQAAHSHTIKPQWSALVGTLYLHAAQRQLPKPIDELQQYELQKRHYAQRLSPQLVVQTGEPYLIVQAGAPGWLFPQYDLANTVADPLAEYILVTYGRPVMPTLLAALSEYAEWDEVTTAVFAISPAQFEAEWHAYLQLHYPIDWAQPD